jgi:hypothetical protein
MVAGTLALPAAALADSSSARSTAEKQCRTERQQMGSAFTSTYGTKANAFGKCVSHRSSQDTADQSSAQMSAEKQCRAMQSSPTFKTTFGTGKNGANAFGKCVSSKAKAMAAQAESTQVSAEDNAAKQCRSAQSSDPGAFSQKYGTKPNAFGKCVAMTASAKEHKSS